VTTGPDPSGYSLEASLGYLLDSSGSGRVALYGCQFNGGHFLSISGCEGQTVLGVEGFLYGSAPAGVASVPVYRCNRGFHYASNDPGCGGDHVDGLLGYALAEALPAPSVQSNPVATPITAPLSRTRGSAGWRLRVRMKLRWTWNRNHTRLRSIISLRRLPRRARITIRCVGGGCPRSTLSGTPRRLRRLLRRGRRSGFTAGDHLLLIVATPGYAPLRVRIKIRFGAVPLLKVS